LLILLLIGVLKYFSIVDLFVGDIPSAFNESVHIQNCIIMILFYGIIIVPVDWINSGTTKIYSNCNQNITHVILQDMFDVVLHQLMLNLNFIFVFVYRK
jgi:hypothetical protein